MFCAPLPPHSCPLSTYLCPHPPLSIDLPACDALKRSYTVRDHPSFFISHPPCAPRCVDPRRVEAAPARDRGRAGRRASRCECMLREWMREVCVQSLLAASSSVVKGLAARGCDFAAAAPAIRCLPRFASLLIRCSTHFAATQQHTLAKSSTRNRTYSCADSQSQSLASRVNSSSLRLALVLPFSAAAAFLPRHVVRFGGMARRRIGRTTPCSENIRDTGERNKACHAQHSTAAMSPKATCVHWPCLFPSLSHVPLPALLHASTLSFISIGCTREVSLSLR